MAPVETERKKQILIVEDEGPIAADVQRRLENLGYSVSGIAASAEEALDCARSTPFDLVLMDIHIRGDMDGIDTAKALTAEFEMPVVYMTAHSDRETLLRAKLTEPYGYVLKPVDTAALLSAVEIAIHKSKMDRRLRTGEAWLRATLRSVGEGIIATNTNGEIELLNNVAEQLAGWQSAEAEGRQLTEVLGLFDEGEALPAKNPVFDLFAGESRAYTLISRSGARLPVEVECFENRAGEEVLGAGSIESRLYRPGRYARLRFRDSGEGMDKATLARIFEPFFTTKGIGRGSGLGLSIVHSGIVQAGGYITATSEPENGTTFEIMLPSVGTVQRVNDGAGPTSGNTAPTVLLVDDEYSVRKLVNTSLEREGYQLLEATNAEEALAIAEVYREPIQVLVTDVAMPGMTGPELAQRLVALRPNLRVLFVSGYRREAMGSYHLPAEQNLLYKPFPAAVLLRRVRLLLGQAASVTP
jgi:PAS domain S-box-containing protein